MANHVISQEQFDEGLRDGWLQPHPSGNGCEFRRMSMGMVGWDGLPFVARFGDRIATVCSGAPRRLQVTDTQLGNAIAQGLVGRLDEHVWQAMDGFRLNPPLGPIDIVWIGDSLVNSTYLIAKALEEQTKAETPPPTYPSRYEILKSTLKY